MYIVYYLVYLIGILVSHPPAHCIKRVRRLVTIQTIISLFFFLLLRRFKCSTLRCSQFVFGFSVNIDIVILIVVDSFLQNLSKCDDVN